MTKEDIELFTNDYFKVLQILDSNEIEINGVTFSPIYYEEIGKALNCTRQKIAGLINELKSQDCVQSLAKGRLQVTSKGKEILKRIECEEV